MIGIDREKGQSGCVGVCREVIGSDRQGRGCSGVWCRWRRSDCARASEDLRESVRGCKGVSETGAGATAPEWLGKSERRPALARGFFRPFVDGWLAEGC